MTKPTLHIPQKDSPQSTLATGINDTETSLVLADSSIFEADAITRLTLGIDETATETVVVSSYDGANTITVVRGTPSYAWLAGTVVARVLNSDDISEIHQYLDHLDGYLTEGAMVTNGDSHDHDGGDGAQIPEGGILNGAITTAKIAAGGVTETNIATGAVTINKIGADAIDGSKIKNDVINSEHIYPGAIDTEHIGDSQITALKIANGAVIEAKIGTGAVTVNKIGTGAVTSEKINSVAMAKVTGLSAALAAALDSVAFEPQFRLSLTTGNPNNSADSASVSTLYYTPYHGDAIQLYNGSAWKIYNLTELSLSLTLTSGKNYDIFINYNSGTPVMVLGSAWTSDTARADELAYQNGRLVKSGTPAYLYVGTIRANGTNTTIDSEIYRYVYNHYNRLKKVNIRQGMTHTTAVADARIHFVIGDPNGLATYCGLSGWYRASGTGYADSYLYSSLIPSTPPGHFEFGFRHYSSGNDLSIWMGGGEAIHFPTGYGYCEFKPAVSSGTIANGVVYAEMER